MQCTQDSSARSVEEEDVRLLPPGVRAAAAVGAGGSGPWSPDPPRRVLLGRRRRGSSAAATPANHACGGRWRSTLRPQAAMRRQSAVAGMQRSSWPPDWRWPLSRDRGSAKASSAARDGGCGLGAGLGAIDGISAANAVRAGAGQRHGCTGRRTRERATPTPAAAQARRAGGSGGREGQRGQGGRRSDDPAGPDCSGGRRREGGGRGAGAAQRPGVCASPRGGGAAQEAHCGEQGKARRGLGVTRPTRRAPPGAARRSTYPAPDRGALVTLAHFENFNQEIA